MSRLVQKYCNDCKSIRRCTTNAAGDGETLVLFLLGFVFFPLWFLLIWRHIGASASCDTCGSSKLQSPR